MKPNPHNTGIAVYTEVEDTKGNVHNRLTYIEGKDVVFLQKVAALVAANDGYFPLCSYTAKECTELYVDEDKLSPEEFWKFYDYLPHIDDYIDTIKIIHIMRCGNVLYSH